MPPPVSTPEPKVPPLKVKTPKEKPKADTAQSNKRARRENPDIVESFFSIRRRRGGAKRLAKDRCVAVPGRAIPAGVREVNPAPKAVQTSSTPKQKETPSTKPKESPEIEFEISSSRAAAVAAASARIGGTNNLKQKKSSKSYVKSKPKPKMVVPLEEIEEDRPDLSYYERPVTNTFNLRLSQHGRER